MILVAFAAMACTPETIEPEPTPGPEPGQDAPEWVGFLADDEVQVQGELIDIRTIFNSSELTVFPQNENYLFDATAMTACGGRPLYAVSLVENPGPEWVRAGSAAAIIVASDCVDLEDPDWVSMGKSFKTGDITYNLHRYKGTAKKAGVHIPRPRASTHSAMVIGPKVSVNNVKVYGDAVITRTDVPRSKSHINNVCITILPDGNYLSLCTGSEGNSRLAFFISRDKGVTWEKYGAYNQDKSLIYNMFTLFVHRGTLYLMGLGDKHMNIYLVKSDDNGMTWTEPTDKDHGLLFEGDCSTASTAIVVSGGRIWKACERYAPTDDNKRPFVMSAPEDSDLLKASNWTFTNVFTQLCYSSGGYTVSGLIEGNIVATRDGRIYDILRTNNYWNSGFATRLEVVDNNKGLQFASTDYSIRMPGGGKKFVIRYDEDSGKYWALSNPDTGFPEVVKHAGISSLNHGGIRNRLALLSSEDTINWTVVDDSVIYDPDPFFHGFQYPDWVFDGDDIIGVVRMGNPDSDGLPIRQHDANMMTFFRIQHFRQ